MSKLTTYYEGCKSAYNPFDEPLHSDNTAHIKALMLVQADIIKVALNERQKLIVDYCICKNYHQNEVAAILGVDPSVVCRTLKTALSNMRKYIVVCDKALTYYHKENQP